jgi:MFS family permease
MVVSTVRTRWLTRGVLAIGIASLCSDLGHEMATTVLPAFLALEIHASAFALGAIEGIADGLASYFKLVGGWLTDRMGRRKPVAVSGYALTAVATASFALATHWVMVLWARAVAWMARGWRGPARNALLADSVAVPYYGNAFGFERAMDTIGAVLAPLLALALTQAGVSYRTIFALTLIPGLMAVLAIGVFVPETPRPPQPARRLLGDVGNLPRRFVVFLTIAGVFGLGQFAPTLLILRATELTGQASTAMALYVLLNVVQAASAYAFGALARRWGSLRLLGLSYLAFALVAAGFAGGRVGTFLATLEGLALLFALAGLAVGGIEAMEPTVAAELLPADLRGTGFGALGAANGLGDLLSSLLVGGLWSAFGPSVGFGFAAACNTLSVLLLVGLLRRGGEHRG